METLYQQTLNVVHDCQFTLGRLEQTRNENDAQPLFRAVYDYIGVLTTNWQQLDQLATKEPVQKKRAARYKVDQIKQELNGLNAAVNNIQQRLTNKWQAAANREELLSQRIRPMETHLNFEEAEYEIHERMKGSHRAVDDLIAQGTAILSDIKTQGMGLKDIRTKILDVGQTLGLSGTTLVMIEKRLKEDWVIFCVGAIFVLIFLFCFYRYWVG